MSRLFVPTLIALAFAACGGKSDKGKAAADPKAPPALAAVKVETGPVEVQKMPRYLRLTGSVYADRQSEVAANVSGRIVNTYVERGQPVKKGQPLVVVDSKAANFQAMAASAQSRVADTQAQSAQQDCARADELFQKGALAKSEYDRQKSQCTSQVYSSNAARAQADLAGKLAGDTVIRSPIDGIVGERYVNVGEYLLASTKVASVYSVEPVRVSISVPEPVVSQVHEGQTVSVRVAAYPDREFPAVVRFVSPALRPATRDLIVEAFAENKDHSLRPGMFATVLLLTGEEDQPTVPSEALQIDGTVRRLFVAKEGVALEMVVRTGVEKGGRTAVLEPLAQGEKVVLKPPAGLRDGTSIQ